MKICSWLFGSQPILKFKSVLGDFSLSTPVVAAGKFRPDWMKKQSNKKVSICPGMYDYFQSGYIITAHTDIHIKANKAGVVINLEPSPCGGSIKPAAFDYAVVEGMAPIQDSVKKTAHKIPLPWTIQAKPGYSAYVLPALMHADFNDKIFVYPGIVDYDRYHVINLVFSPLKECEFTIWAGQPILHVIPFKREAMTAECGKATEHEKDKHWFCMPSKMKHYYRRFLSERKKFEMKCPHGREQ